MDALHRFLHRREPIQAAPVFRPAERQRDRAAHKSVRFCNSLPRASSSAAENPARKWLWRQKPLRALNSTLKQKRGVSVHRVMAPIAIAGLTAPRARARPLIDERY